MSRYVKMWKIMENKGLIMVDHRFFGNSISGREGVVGVSSSMSLLLMEFNSLKGLKEENEDLRSVFSISP